MSKIFSLFLFSFLFFTSNLEVKAIEQIKIYSRSEWGANEEYRYIDSTYWKNILENRKKNAIISNKKWNSYSQVKKNSIISKNRIKSDKKIKQNNYLSTNFSDDIKLIEYHKYDGKNKLAWPVGKTEYIKNIVIHHTQSEYKDSFIGIKNIYKYHSINRQWGDIGYHFIIGYNGEIFEGRAGGDYAVGAHDTWNNRSTIGISVMGNYNKSHLKPSQYRSIKKLISYLTKKYGIDLNKKIPYHKECFGKKCINGLETKYYFPIVGHQDGKSTACPGKNIYNNIIPLLIKELQVETTGYIKISNKEITQKKKKYLEKTNGYSWNNVKSKFDKISKKQKILIIKYLENKLKYNFFDWKKEILYKRFLKEIN